MRAAQMLRVFYWFRTLGKYIGPKALDCHMKFYKEQRDRSQITGMRARRGKKAPASKRDACL
jgi:hypothetical protein